MSLVIDSREQGNIEPVRDLFLENDIEVGVSALEFGDYLMEFPDGRAILVERKTPIDFIHSTTPTQQDPAGKLARQLNGVIESGATPVLLIDGYYSPLKGGRLRTKKIIVKHSMAAFASKLRSVQRHGVRVEYNPIDWYLPQFLLDMYRNESKDNHETLSLAPKAFQVPSKKEVKWTILLGIRGVGPKMAQDLLASFGTVRDVASASHADLMKVKGVGKKTAEQIHWYLN